jgi:proline iminopeptidase
MTDTLATVPTADVSGTMLHFEIDGEEGRPCLVLHGGLGVDHVVYRRTLGPLLDIMRLLYVDHRGNGRSAAIALETVTMEQLADDAVAVADMLGFERFCVLGHSYGGFIAQELALRHADRVEALILVATTPGQLSRDETPAGQGPPMPPELLEKLTSVPGTDVELAAGMLDLLPYYFHRLALENTAPLFDGTIYRAALMARGFEVLASWSSVDRLERIAAPTLLLAGRHDLFTSCPQSYRIAGRLKDAEVAVFEDSGHFPWIEEPNAFFATVHDWLGRKLGA